MKILGCMLLLSLLTFRMETLRSKDFVSELVYDEIEGDFENVSKNLTAGWQRVRRNGRRVLRR